MPQKAHKLRSGFTTGTAAAAAAKAALLMLIENRRPDRVGITLLTGDPITIRVHRCQRMADHAAVCTVIKDAGDDPDITHGAEIGTRVDLKLSGTTRLPTSRITIRGGQGVGRVTKPGLELPPGNAAINPGPRKMITQAVETVLKAHGLSGVVNVEVFVPHGEILAQKTLNARLGIVGGISILGTTGVVRPMSHAAYIATIKSALSVAHATGQKQVVLATGRRSERFAENIHPHLVPEAFIQIGDYFQQSLVSAATHSFRKITLAVFFGKALKMAQGFGHTHAAKASMSLEHLARWAVRITGDTALAQRIRSANTARHAFDLIYPDYPETVHHVGRRIVAVAKGFLTTATPIHVNLFDYSGNLVFDTNNQLEMES